MKKIFLIIGLFVVVAMFSGCKKQCYTNIYFYTIDGSIGGANMTVNGKTKYVKKDKHIKVPQVCNIVMENGQKFFIDDSEHCGLVRFLTREGTIYKLD